MVAVERPKSRNTLNTPITAVTMPTNPKSFGSSRRAMIMRDPVLRMRVATWEKILATPPRIALCLRSLIVVRSQNQLAGVEGFGVSALGIAFHAAQSHQGGEGALLKPAF